MKNQFAAILVMFLFCRVYAQLPVYHQSFETLPVHYNAIKGIKGNALNLTATAAYRVPVMVKNTGGYATGNFSVSLWAKAAKGAGQAYSILAGMDTTSNKNSYSWQIGMQVNGAWNCKIQYGKVQYDYSPTPSRQSIQDGKWHLLAFTFDTAKREAAFYFDGNNKAIIHTPEISKLTAEQLLIGGMQAGYFNEWETFNGCMDEVKIFNAVVPAGFFLKEYNHTLSIPSKKIVRPLQANSFSVMNYNILHGGHETGKETGVQRIVDVINASGADIISMEETYGSGPIIADALGYYFYLRSTNLGIFSRYPIETTLPGGVPFNNGGVLIQMPGRKKIAFFTNWITYPVDYWDLFEKGQTIDSAAWYQQQDNVNTQTLRNTLESIATSVDNAENVPVIFCGDLNTGSHLDWIESTRHLNHGYVMPFPTTMLMQQRGFIDSYRALHPDPLTDRGITWSPMLTTAFKDRIDYIFYKSRLIKPVTSVVINTHPVRYPSDHAAVITKFVWVK